MSNINELTERVVKFRDERDWKQFHNLKDCALSLTLEATEVLEHFQWKNEKEVEEYVKTNKGDIAEEVCDVLSWVLILAHDLEIDLAESFEKKIRQNEGKYPIAKARGKSLKYNQL